jgi:hypothetical protein
VVQTGLELWKGVSWTNYGTAIKIGVPGLKRQDSLPMYRQPVIRPVQFGRRGGKAIA